MGTQVPHDDPLLMPVSSEPQACPYILGQTARLPLYFVRSPVPPHEVDRLLEAGYRRTGPCVYRTACAGCRACEPTRIVVAKFRLSKSQKRVRRRGDRELEVRIGPPEVSPRRIELFNLHRDCRGLALHDETVKAIDYRAFLIDSFCETLEFSYWRDGRLIAVSILDVGASAASAVYAFFDPAAAEWSPGTYSILRQIEWCRENAKEHLYLGFYVATNRHLNYKQKFLPQERKQDDVWHVIEQRSR